MATHFVYNSTRGALSGNRRAIILMIGYWAFWLASVHDILLALGVIRSTSLIFVGTFVASVGCLLVTADIFAETFKSNKTLLKEVEEANINLESRIKERTYDLFLTTQNLKTILDNLPQGVLVINEDFTIGAEHSKSALSIFEKKKIENLDFFEFVSEHISFDSNQKEQFTAVLSSCLGEHVINFEANRELLPYEWEINRNETIKYFRLGWAPILDENDSILRILLTVADITQLKRLERESQLNQSKSEVIASIIDGTFEKSKRFISKLRQKLNQYGQSDSDFFFQEEIKQIFRDLHSAKGNARLLRLNHLAQVCHQAETELASLVHLEKVKVETMEAILQEFVETLSSFEKALKEFDPSKKASPHSVGVLSSEQGRLFQYIKNCKVAVPIKADLTLNQLTKFRGLDQIISDLGSGLAELTEATGKPETELVYEANEAIFLSEEFSHDLNDMLLHLVRNSIDHGIEPMETRRLKNKSETGSIQLICEKRNDSLVIEFSDDGAGIDLTKIRKKAVKLKINGAEDMSPLEIASLIFQPNFSTAEKISDISGRGFGMNIVQNGLNRWKGTITWLDLSTEPNHAERIPFNIRIQFPFSGNVIVFDRARAAKGPQVVNH